MAAKKRLSTIADQVPLLTPAQFLALPAQPDGTVVRVQVDAAAGINWRFRLNKASANAAKWEYDGGPDLFAAVATIETIGTLNAFVAVATAGPSITVPLTGDYRFGLRFTSRVDSADSQVLMGMDIGATPAGTGNAAMAMHSARTDGGLTLVDMNANEVWPITAIAAGTAVVAKYRRIVASAASVSNRHMYAGPVRVNGPAAL